MASASLETDIFSSAVLTQSNIPLQPLAGKVKLELVVVGRLWMLSTERRKRMQNSERLKMEKDERKKKKVSERMSRSMKFTVMSTDRLVHLKSQMSDARCGRAGRRRLIGLADGGDTRSKETLGCALGARTKHPDGDMSGERCRRVELRTHLNSP